MALQANRLQMLSVWANAGYVEGEDVTWRGSTTWIHTVSGQSLYYSRVGSGQTQLV